MPFITRENEVNKPCQTQFKESKILVSQLQSSFNNYRDLIIFPLLSILFIRGITTDHASGKYCALKYMINGRFVGVISIQHIHIQIILFLIQSPRVILVIKS